MRRIPCFHCSYDPAWSVAVLLLAGPTLEELQLKNATAAHCAALRDMPRLQRLQLDDFEMGVTGCVAAPRHSASLKWLRVCWLAEAPTWSLLKGHAASLEEVELRFATEPVSEREWPYSCCPDLLETQLRQCDPRRLQRLVLWRPLQCHFTTCRAQLDAARRALQGCSVKCAQCAELAYSDF